MKKVILYFICFVAIGAIGYADVLDFSATAFLHAVWIGLDSKVYYNYKAASEWKEPVCVADGATSVSVALDKTGFAWIVWSGYDGVSTAIFSAHWTGDGWSSIAQVDSVDMYPDRQPCIIVDKNNTPWVTWVAGDGRDDDIYVTHWDGRRWANEVMVNIDDLSPDVSPVINIVPSEKDSLIIVWLGYNGNNYQLYQSIYNGKQWLIEEPVYVSSKGVFGEIPSLLVTDKRILSMYWSYKGQWYMSLYENSVWTEKVPVELVYPDQFDTMNICSYVTIAWENEYLRNNFRFMPKKKFIEGRKQMVSSFCTLAGTSTLTGTSKRMIAFVSDFLCPSAVADVELSKYIGFGDSITQGYGDNGWEGEGYVPRLERRLDANIGESTVINEGIGGETTFEGLDRIDSVLTEHNAQFILLMEGSNDVLFGYSAESITFNLGEMIERSRNYGTTPILGNQIPRRDNVDLNNYTRDTVNPAITNLAVEKDVRLADHYEALSQNINAYINPYDQHPNGAGYELMSELWFNEIDAILNPPDTDEDDGGCGTVAFPVYRNNGNGLNFMLVILAIILVYCYRIRLYREY